MAHFDPASVHRRPPSVLAEEARKKMVTPHSKHLQTDLLTKKKVAASALRHIYEDENHQKIFDIQDLHLSFDPYSVTIYVAEKKTSKTEMQLTL